MPNTARRDISAQIMTGFGIMLLVAIILMHGAILLVAENADALAAARESRLVTTAAESRIGGMTAGRRDMLSRTPPNALPQPAAHGQMLLISPAGEILRTWRGDQAQQLSPSGLNQAVVPALAMLRDPARQIPRARPAGFNFIWLGERPILVMAVDAAETRGDLLIDIQDLSDYLPGLSQRFNLPNVSLGRSSELGRDFTPLRIVNPDNGQPLVSADLSLGWDPIQVGRAITAKAMPIIWSVTALFLLAGGWLVHRARSLARSLMISEAQAKHLSLHDSMTGLANRALFTDRLDLAINQRRRGAGAAAVAIIDLDRFKKVNDTLGHQAGDALIREAAKRLTAVCRVSDTVARLGGDEFALVLSPVDGEAGLLSLCERLSKALTGLVDLPGGQALLSASLGVALIGDDQIESIDAVRQADLALYRAKADGRGCYVLFKPEMDESARLRQVVETELREVIARQGLEVAYQPQCNAKGMIEGVEALVRWRHPVRGAMSPATFVPIAEEAGLIDQLGEFVMRRALTDASRWPGLKIAINISPLQLRRPGFVEFCNALAAEAGVRPERVELEITEGVLLENEPQVQEALTGLRKSGFRLALDDFGTGYSSLSYLNVYPVDKIKIDRSFVRNLGLDGAADADKVVRAIIHLGHVLGLSVTAEGVETEAQRVTLVAAGCNSLQGYLHGRPAPAAEIDKLIRSGSAGRAVA